MGSLKFWFGHGETSNVTVFIVQVNAKFGIWRFYFMKSSLTNFSSFFSPAFSVKEDDLLRKPFQKAKQGSVVHRRFAAEEWDRYL